MRARARFRIRRSYLINLWYVFDRFTGAVVTAPTHTEAVERIDTIVEATLRDEGVLVRSVPAEEPTA